MEPITCRYCGVEWDPDHHRFAHHEHCYILTGVFPPVVGRKKRAPPPEPVKPLLALDKDFE